MAAKQNKFFENSLATYDEDAQIDCITHPTQNSSAEATDGATKKPIVAGNNVGNLQSYLFISRQSNALSLVLSPASF
ncbi:hypothetical protein RHMOL_Rhmol08G0139400 [Rhododendron molle]|uniref:Uncharacterized protein n=1 Tax=Rhododendron molle TaxID=49168 RepID=A0ACC0MQ73_RHOML|nr:hypothetical protein RHMOL_Rhmol08G0139400 [Rhododendron molle]